MSKSFAIRFQPFDRQVQVLPETTVFAAAQQANVFIQSDCGGQGTCGKCRVKVDPAGHVSPLSDIEKKFLKPKGAVPACRLACQTRITGPLTVTCESLVDLDQITSDKTDISHRFSIDPDISYSKPYGVAIDVGTTTLAVYLCDMNSGRVLTAKAAANPQIRFGQDVISRIAAADKDHNTFGRMRKVLIKAINDLIYQSFGDIADKNNDFKNQVDQVVIVGNPTMEYFVYGRHPHELGIYPYTPADCFFPDVSAEKIGLDLDGQTKVNVFEVVSGFVGGDTLAVILTQETSCLNKTCLIIDIGTNGEVVLAHENRLYATSCATGPVFEGGHISCGMRAKPGAIDHVEWDHDRHEFFYHTIGQNQGHKPMGICGSGIIDAVAQMCKIGLIEPNGRIRGAQSNLTRKNGKTWHLVLAPAQKSGLDDSITITQADIRQIQLGKAAMAVGIEMLMERANIDHIDQTILTGAFGASFSVENAFDIGMFPDSMRDSHIEIQPNLAGQGAIMALLDPSKRNDVSRLAESIEHIELAAEPGFSDLFTQKIMFPDLMSH